MSDWWQMLCPAIEPRFCRHEGRAQYKKMDRPVLIAGRDLLISVDALPKGVVLRAVRFGGECDRPADQTQAWNLSQCLSGRGDIGRAQYKNLDAPVLIAGRDLLQRCSAARRRTRRRM